MSQTFEEKVQYHLSLFTAPDYTAKGDAVNFFKANHKQAIPILEEMAATNPIAAQMLDVARSAAKDDKPPKKNSYMANNPDLF